MHLRLNRNNYLESLLNANVRSVGEAGSRGRSATLSELPWLMVRMSLSGMAPVLERNFDRQGKVKRKISAPGGAG